MEFNKEPEKQSALIKNIYSLIYKGKRIEIKGDYNEKKIRHTFTLNLVMLMKGSSFFKELNTSRNKDNMIDAKLFSFDARNIVDEEGNEINAPTYGYLNQFREFFVQQVKPNATGPVDSLYMKKDKPIFENQPIVKPDDFSELWMNTPLKTIDN